MSIERFSVELRAEVTGRKLVGHAAMFGQTADVRSHYEQLASTAFDAALADDATDVRALFNHDPSQLLGRQSAGTLTLEADPIGLAFEIDLPDTTLGRDVRELVDRGDITGGSFGFVPGANTVTRAADGRRLRTHTSVRRLVDVSVVTFPAYGGADVALRSLQIGQLPDRRRRLLLSRARAMGLHPSTDTRSKQ